MRRAGCAALALLLLALPAAAGAETTWTEADKDGYGTSATRASKVWHTLDDGRLTEVFYPDLGTPSVRALEFVVRGRGFRQVDTDARRRGIRLLGSRSLTFRQVNVQPGRYRIVKTYVTDPARNVLLLRVRFRSLGERKLRLYLRYDPSLGNDHDDDRARPSRRALLARDSGSPVASAVISRRFRRTSSVSRDGDVVQRARTALTGVGRRQRMTVALGFGKRTHAALRAARRSLRGGFRNRRRAYEAGWRSYMRGLRRAPAAANRRLWNVSAMMLAAHEDKTYRGGYIASPSMPWVWGTDKIENPSGAYHLVWSRDLYQIGTALIAAGDRAGANRAVDYLFFRQQKPDGSFPQNSTVDGAEHWENLQLDQVALPIVLAWQLGRTGPALYGDHIKRAADFIVNYPYAPMTPQERWENQAGFSPGTIAAEIAGLICAADIARKNGDTASAERWERTADDWQRQVDSWTATTNGPYSPRPYYLRLTKDGDPNAGTTYSIGDSGPTVDQRKVVDPSYLELVRLGVKPASHPVVTNTVSVVDQQLASGRPDGRYFWHRFNFDGYGEQKDGSPWDTGFPPNPTEVWANNQTIGRNWPLFGGERGEYELLLGNRAAARTRLAHMASSANRGLMMPEQVWAPDFPPAGQPGFPLGEGTFSATPLAWTHAQYLRLARSIAAGHPVERPGIVARRYGG